jgi:MFS family permease
MSKKYRLLFGFLILNILTGICSGIFSIVLPMYVINLGAGAGQVGLVKGISGIGALLMVLPSGLLVDNYGSKRLYILGSIISMATTAVLSFLSSSVIIIGAMLIQGFSNSLRFTSLNASFFGRLKEIGMNKSGWYRGSLSIGLTFIGPFIGGILTKYLGYPTIFQIVAVLTIIPSAFLFMVDNSKSGSIQKKRKLKEAFLISVWVELFQLFKRKDIRNTIIMEGISTACFSTFASFIVVYAVTTMGVDTQQATNFIIIEGTAYIVAVFTLGGLMLKYSKKTLYLISSLVMCLGLLFIGSAGHTVVILSGIVLLGAGTGLLNILTFSNLGSNQAKKGKISSALSACTSLGMSLGPMVSGAIGELYDYNAIFLSYIPVLLVMVFITQFHNRRLIWARK